MILLISSIGLFLLFINDKKIIFNLNNSKISFFTGLILISLLSFLWSPEWHNSFNSILILLDGLVLYIFFISLKTQKIINTEKIINWWLILTLFNFLLQLLLILNKEIWLSIISTFFGDDTIKVYLLEQSRGRIIPLGSIYSLFLVGIIKIFNKKNKNHFFGILIYCLGLISLIISNYRSMVITAILGIIIAIFLTRKKLQSNLFKISLLSLLIIFVTTFIFGNITGSSVMDRFLLKSTSDKNSISSRLQYAWASWDMFSEEPFKGVSVGNFSYLSNPISIYSNKGVKLGELPGQTHCQLLSWLAETGIIGFLIFVSLILNFIIIDLKNYLNKKINYQTLILIIASYVYLLGSFMDTYPTYGFLTFWIIRGIVDYRNYGKK